jgi:hypothetical protein
LQQPLVSGLKSIRWGVFSLVSFFARAKDELAAGNPGLTLFEKRGYWTVAQLIQDKSSTLRDG